MQDVFWYIKEAIDAYFDGRPFQATVKAGCLIGKKRDQSELLPAGHDRAAQLPNPPSHIAAGSVRLGAVFEPELPVEELDIDDSAVVISPESPDDQKLDAFIDGKNRPQHLDD